MSPSFRPMRATAAASRMSPATNRTSLGSDDDGSAASKTTTSSPRRTSSSARYFPVNPRPPVITWRMPGSLSAPRDEDQTRADQRDAEYPLEGDVLGEEKETHQRCQDVAD